VVRCELDPEGQPFRFWLTKSQFTRFVRNVSMNFGRALRWSLD
jgi:hypothetical protein